MRTRSCARAAPDGNYCPKQSAGPASHVPNPNGSACFGSSMANPAWSGLYRKAKWLRLAAHQLETHPLCVKCLSRGQFTPATVADHVTPHKGNINLFWLGELQSLCAHCHNRFKTIEELCGYTTDIDHDGWPTD